MLQMSSNRSLDKRLYFWTRNGKKNSVSLFFFLHFYFFKDAVDIKKSTGIPQSFMVPVEGPQVPGAMMTPNGSFAVPALDHQAYNFKPVPAPAVQEMKPDIPEDLVCSICSDLLADAVMIPCCGNSFCDECIRFFLLESEEHECPDCHEKEISPVTLIPNR